ncbi:MAG TPA: hypothetical protein VHN58_10105 [Croceicoccus sp.]|nr:hypothetical protein [Croceicoccus sp.]
MNVVYRLPNGGTVDFRDIDEEVPWIEISPPTDAAFDRDRRHVDRSP